MEARFELAIMGSRVSGCRLYGLRFWPVGSRIERGFRVGALREQLL